MTTRYAPWHCANCGYQMNSASHPTEDDAVPDEGDLSICLSCAEPHTLDGGKWRPVTDDELIDLTLEVKRVMSCMQHKIREFHKQRGQT